MVLEVGKMNLYFMDGTGTIMSVAPGKSLDITSEHGAPIISVMDDGSEVSAMVTNCRKFEISTWSVG